MCEKMQALRFECPTEEPASLSSLDEPRLSPESCDGSFRREKMTCLLQECDKSLRTHRYGKYVDVNFPS